MRYRLLTQNAIIMVQRLARLKGKAKKKKMSCYFLFTSYMYHNTKLRPSNNNIQTHTRLKVSNLIIK